MRRTFIPVLAIMFVLAPRPANAWGLEIHKFITAQAIALLPAEIRPFFEKYRDSIVEHSIDPDLWRVVGWEAETPNHWVDMDAYGPYPFKELPHDFDEAVKRYGPDFVNKNGLLPWRAQEIHGKLVEAFTQKAQYSRDNIKLFSSVIAHYVADGHVPFHATLNHDGQLTGQWGLHSRFETELFERYKDRLRLTPGKLVPIDSPREFLFTTLTQSFPYIQPVLDADKAAVAGRELYDDEYFTLFFGKVQPILERRLSDAITSVASMIADAWQDAGRPALALDAPRTPRTVRRQ